MTYSPRPPPREVPLLREDKKSPVISHCGVQQTNALEAMNYVTDRGKKVCLSPDSYSCEK